MPVVFAEPSKLRSAWSTTLSRAGTGVVLNPQMARSELEKSYGQANDAERADLDNLVAALEAGSFQVIESASYREEAADRLVEKFGLTYEQSMEIVGVLAPDRLKLKHPSGKSLATPASEVANKRRGASRWLVAGLGTLALLGLGAAGFAVYKYRNASSERGSLSDEVDRLTKREGELKGTEKQLVDSQALVADLKKQIGSAGQDGAPGSGLAGELADTKKKLEASESKLQSAQGDVSSLKADLAQARKDADAAANAAANATTVPQAPPAPFAFAANIVAPAPGVVHLKATLSGTCNDPARCSANPGIESDAQLVLGADGTLTLGVSGFPAVVLDRATAPLWSGTVQLGAGLGFTCKGKPVQGPFIVYVVPDAYQADVSNKQVLATHYTTSLIADSATCPWSTLTYLGELVAS